MDFEPLPPLPEPVLRMWDDSKVLIAVTMTVESVVIDHADPDERATVEFESASNRLVCKLPTFAVTRIGKRYSLLLEAMD